MKRKSIDNEDSNPLKKRKSPSVVQKFSAELRYDIEKYASEHGNAEAQTYFFNLVGFKIKEQTVRKFKKAFIAAISTAEMNGKVAPKTLPTNEATPPKDASRRFNY